MSAIKGFSFRSFKNSIIENLGKDYKKIVKSQSENLHSIFDQAAKDDGGKSDKLYEKSIDDFNSLVQQGVLFIKMLVKVKDIKANAGRAFNGEQSSITSTQGNNNVSDDSHTAKDEALVSEKEPSKQKEINEEMMKRYRPADK